MRNNLKELREKRKWTQTDMAQWLSVSPREIRNIESHRQHPSLRLANRISALFKLPVGEVFDLAD